MTEHNNEEFVNPIKMPTSEVFSRTQTPDYSLSLVEFNELKRGSSELLSAAKSLFFIGIGYLIPLTPKFIRGGATAVSPEEWKVLGWLAIFTVVFFIVSFALPNFSMLLPTEKGKTLRRIQRFFDGNEPTKHAVRDGE